MINLFKGFLSGFYVCFPESCLVCKQVLPSYTPCLVCQSCLDTVIFSDLQSIEPFPALSCVDYEHPVIRTVLTTIKFHHNQRVAEAWALVMLDKLKTMKRFPISGAVWVPIPIHPNRLKQRGFNQVDVLFKPIARSLGLDYVPILRRVKDTVPLFGLNPHERLGMISGAFGLDEQYLALVKGRQIVIVDDIFTTGASLLEAATVLQGTGAKGILGFTLAKAWP